MAGLANAVHALLPLVTDVWWAALPEPGKIHATARWSDVLHHIDPGPYQNLLHEALQAALRLAEER